VKGTLKWLVEQHLKSGEWASFRPATRKQREAIFRRAIAKSPDLRLAAITSSSFPKLESYQRA
jgi:hypothetical protein